MPGQDQAALLGFLDHAADANLMQKGTAQSLKSACRAVLSVLDDQEREDILALDLDDVLQRYAATPHSSDLDPVTIRHYQLRVRNAIAGFQRYHADPANWRPGSRRQRRPRHAKHSNTEPPPDTVQPATAEAIVHHFPLRAGHFVRITGIPFDITKSEMARLTTQLSYLVAPAEEQTRTPATAPEPEYAPPPDNVIGHEPISASCTPERYP